ncbi:MAG TPA: SRPBCC domain-containing protein [Gemmataceae bacterium]|nr:SRPBCC domain-containing protein [Gemmataceae bacterium]
MSLLTAPTATDREVLITRVFDAPRDLVFRAWADPERLTRWYAPPGCAIRFAAIDVRPGGRFHSCITIPNGHECWCVGEYREVAPPGRLVFTMVSADAAGNVVEPTDVGMDPDWPRETVVTVTFEDAGGKTRLTLHQTVSEVVAKRTGAYPSWLAMLDRLAEQLT